MREFIAMGLLLLPLHSSGADVGGVAIEDNTRIGSQSLLLNGAGLRIKIVFKVYAAGLYLPEKAASAAAVLAQKGAKRISMILMRDLTAQQLVEALNEGIRDNHIPAEVHALKSRTEHLSAIMTGIGTAKSGSTITLDYVPETGTRVTLNGKLLGDAIAGDDFYRALLRIWLGNDPVDESLKKALLGHGRLE